jgi:pimeloyl-ACP methyl ester carboxylesterase
MDEVEMTPGPFIREAGTGPGVVCLHANLSSSSQWRMLMEELAPRCRVVAPDSYGAGQSPAMPQGQRISLRDEVAFLEPAFARAGESFTLVGHSYGAAVALIMALEQPHRVRGLALYEPTLFGLVDAESATPNDADGIRHAVAAAVAALENHDPNRAAEIFTDYWTGEGAWSRMSEARQGSIAAAVVQIRGWAHALFDEPTPLAAFSQIRIPVLYMMGANSPASARAVGRLLTDVLPQVHVVTFDGLGHMGPISHPAMINAAIASAL